jgi:deazaflavin-dependent oxidoreductase (nitroreductase family)
MRRPVTVAPAGEESMTTSENTRERPLLGLRRRPGRLALRFMRLPLNAYRHDKGHLLGHTFVEFDHVGRKTGKTYQAVAMVLRHDKASGEVVICRGWETDWYRNLQVHPGTHVTVGRESYAAEQRLLSEDEAVAVGQQFRRDHPHRMRLISRILGWGDLRDDTRLRQFVRDHPFVAFQPVTRPEAAPAHLRV